jgi:hypothetical protein
VIAFLLSLLISQNAAQPPATTTIRGRVVRADGRPIARARVRLLMVPSPTTSMGDATTDEDGRYEITGTWPLPFRVAASKSGYTTAQYGERRGSEPGETITMKPGDIRERVDFVLKRHSAIVGRVLFSTGRAYNDQTEGMKSFADLMPLRKCSRSPSSSPAFLRRYATCFHLFLAEPLFVAFSIQTRSLRLELRTAALRVSRSIGAELISVSAFYKR